ncbi:lysylphosphatidylglycerol synthase domain-containing protein [Thermoleophilum album]|uniref:Phosphatidylinositol alpha-mannosyltransferase n=1 Tax=Thermoleophilum album TaxID=29539 RepID=A0A1H6FMM3_THEAL|nr:lysylphosphatidylglycerol synthase domain-containing protein [Thermoleophilum album]SEH12126.1 phosphatidylinositol alpha-mannosyltransferase [Thermoleophilum album]
MRIAVVSPYSLNYPGGVGQHAEALTRELRRRGHEAVLLAPWDPNDRVARWLHRGLAPRERELAPWIIPLGRTLAIPANGSQSNLCLSPNGVARLGHLLRRGRFDVVHVHEPNAPAVSWYAVEHARAPVVATFHAFSTSAFANHFAANIAGARRLYAKIAKRIAVSEAAAWTARRFYGGRYEIVPNGVDLERARRARAELAGGERSRRDQRGLRIAFLGRADERKGLPVLLRAFEALRRAGVEAQLVVAGPAPEEVRALALELDGIDPIGPVDEHGKWRLLAAADVLVAPSLGGESFGMVLTEALAAGTPVVASDIPGYREVARDCNAATLAPPGDAAELATRLRQLAADEHRLARMSEAAARDAERYAWPRVAERVEQVYEQALAQGMPSGVAVRFGLRPVEQPRPPAPARIPPPGADREVGRRGRRRALRRAATALGGLAACTLVALALKRLGIDAIGSALLKATPAWVLLSLALMSASLLLRAEAWHAIMRSALSGIRVRRRDAARGTMIGVLMSATLPARLGEPSRALVVARRLGRVRDRLPLVLGTLVSQTILNLLALAALGAITLSSLEPVRARPEALVGVVAVPLALVLLLASFPWLLPNSLTRGGGRLASLLALVRAVAARARAGLAVFRRPRLALWAATCQTGAWALQLLSCYVLLRALGLDVEQDLGAAAAVLFAVNVTAVLPATPSNVGVFQAACVAVLSVYGVGRTDAFAYGIILQAVELATAFALGVPALVGEGLTWRELRLRALHAAPVELPRVSASRERAARVDA